jgi:hypothetical protein
VTLTETLNPIDDFLVEQEHVSPRFSVLIIHSLVGLRV